MENNNKYVYILLSYIIIVGMSCNFFFKTDPLKVLNNYTSIGFLRQDVRVTKFEEKRAGMAGKETTLLAIYKINRTLNIDSLRKEGKILDYKLFPIPNMDLGNGFDGNLKPTDHGLYLYKDNGTSSEDELIIINITQNKIIISANY